MALRPSGADDAASVDGKERLLEIVTALTEELSAAELVAIRALLVASFGPEYSEASWDHCLGGTHFVPRYWGELISHVAVISRHIAVAGTPLHGAYVESVATRPDFWGRRFGTALLAVASAYIVDAFEVGVMSTDRIEFYRRAGWQVWAGRSFVEGIDGERRTESPRGTIMAILPTTSTIGVSQDISTDWRRGDIW